MNITIDERMERADTIGLAEAIPATRRRSRKWLWAAFAVTAAGAAALGGWRYAATPQAPAYNLAQVRRGDIATVINATGKVQAVTTVQVGTQVSGTVSHLYVDFNDRVKAGQIVARLDPSQIQAQVQQAQANLAGAEASVSSARSALASQQAAVAASKANLERVEAVVLEANRAYENTVKLVEAGAAPARQLETQESSRLQALAQKAQAEAQYAQAQAQANASKSQLAQSEAQAAQSRAAVEVAKVNLERTVIRSPIDGVVVSRNVDVGQTVAASLQAPVLFLIANDLTKMQVLADVDEADVGQLSVDSKVSFTVDAFPRETFKGRISQIRLSPTVVQNVVTYTAVIDVDNPKMQLKPGMTATVTATVAEANNVLLVPNAALRFQPADQPAARGAAVWREVDGRLERVKVRTGLSDGISTEVIAPDLKEGDRIATATASAAPAAAGAQKKAGAFPGMGGGQQKMRRF